MICKTIIAFGSPNKSGKKIAHGVPLGKKEVEETYKALGWDKSEFLIPEEVYKCWNAKNQGKKKEKLWKMKFSYYKKIILN